ncbi:dephospho-CoA kinase/protein folding accessory domain-containing protein [Nocardioides dokdonensis FR1436]|uniref:Dephospho-CoA kinase/protein folding accessory domain-containing protein n=1 Tax=Nocardioides dokdonensis FR1436 TaxID=1300347 RepID=A0A1A9GN17_9ACTN|nr:GrpB family protein [Nocardioides dokdonensis]ANH39689.1 dephospho-CoA kinase/protein folding accessory domain-containing protein [Nocardioides dokdonensis FR1436]
MPSRDNIVTFHDIPTPVGEQPYVPGAGPSPVVTVVDPDPDWPLQYAELAARVRDALGWRVLELQHIGSTSVPGLAAKPIIDMDLVVADADDEAAYVPALEAAGFELRVREPWWFGHRVLRHTDPACGLHVFGPDAPEPIKHRIFRDWLRGNPGERDLYARAKRAAAAASTSAGEHSMQYNARKEQVVREICRRAFTAAGLLDGSS